jgi:uncharacterized protein (TIGR04222 family)
VTPEYAAIWEAIRTFDIDGEPRALTFAARLARENGWSVGFAERVVLEYKRFVFLAVTGTTPVTPSDQVDQAWHLHLTYTRSYWERFCGEVLRRPLHHEPTKGGPDEAARFDEQYRHTLARYEQAFGAPPPADVWPAPEQRFGDDLHFVRVNARRNRVVPRRTGGWFRALLPLVALLLCGAEWKPETPAERAAETREGAGFFLAIGAAALVTPFFLAGLRVRRACFAVPPELEAVPAPRFGPYEVAYLEGGWARAAAVAVARLLRDGVLRYEANTRWLFAVEPLGAAQHPVEAAIYAAVAAIPEGATVQDVTVAARANGAGGFEPLLAAGVALAPNAARAARVRGAMVGFTGVVVYVCALVLICVTLAPFPAAFIGFVGVLVWSVALADELTPERWHTVRGETVLSDARAALATDAAQLTDAPVAIALSGPAVAAAQVPLAAQVNTFFALPVVPKPRASGTNSGGSGHGEGGCGGCGGCGG